MSEQSREQIPQDDRDAADVDAEDTPIGRMIAERPEVRDVDLNFGHECVVLLVRFETWAIPSDFAGQYDMHLMSAGIVDDRPRWKRVLGIGRQAWIEARYVRDGQPNIGGSR